jgi:Spy/CpxP family protein refolding chaperone
MTHLVRRMVVQAMGSMTAIVVAVCSAQAQGGPPMGGPPMGGPPAGGRQGRALDEAQRERLERSFQQRLDGIVRQRLNLTDEQHGKLREVASRTEDARRQLRTDELTTRLAMRRELLAGDRANEARVSELLERMPKLERRRLELMETEQRELARFLSPLQRARYFALQDELRRGMQELQRRRLGMDDSVANSAQPRARRRPPP